MTMDVSSGKTDFFTVDGHEEVEQYNFCIGPVSKPVSLKKKSDKISSCGVEENKGVEDLFNMPF